MQKHKFTSICKIERFRQNFGPTGYQHSQLATFPENRFPAIFGGHRSFFAKNAKMHLSWTWCETEQFQRNFDPQGISGVYW